MEILNELVKICNDFLNNDFNIELFQHKLETIILPDKCKKTLEKEQHNACNELEEIMYCYSTSQKAHADRVARKLICATLKEQEHLKDYL